MSAPNSPCYRCSSHQFGCKKDCERWVIYEREYKAWKKAVQTEKSRYLNILDAEAKRRVAEKKKKRSRKR